MNTSEHDRLIRVNRAPVLTLWATVVAERLGFDRDAALTLGRAVAGSSAQMKGRELPHLEINGARFSVLVPQPEASIALCPWRRRFVVA